MIVWMKHDWQICPEAEAGGGGEGSYDTQSSGEADEGETKGCELSVHVISAIVATAIFLSIFGYMVRRARSVSPRLRAAGHCVRALARSECVHARAIRVCLRSRGDASWLQVHQMCQIAKYLAIPDQHLVAGDLTVATTDHNRLDIVAEGEEAIPAAR